MQFLAKGEKMFTRFPGTGAKGVKMHSFSPLLSNFWNISVRLKIMPVGWPQVTVLRILQDFCFWNSACKGLDLFSYSLVSAPCFTYLTLWSPSQGLAFCFSTSASPQYISQLSLTMLCINSAHVGVAWEHNKHCHLVLHYLLCLVLFHPMSQLDRD